MKKLTKELVKVDDCMVQLNSEVVDMLFKFQKKKAEMDLEEKRLKKALLKAFTENGLKSFENDELKITLKEGYTRKSIDKDKLKEMGIYDDVLKENEVNPSISITWKI